MSIDPNTDLPKDRERALSLTKVLRQCEDIQGLVAESVRNLAMLDLAIKHYLDTPAAPPPAETVLRSTEAIQISMQKASEKLSVVVRALGREVRERDMLDLRFAASVEQEEGARHASLHDALTGMPNRALFHDRLEHGLAQAKRHGWTLALMFVDLDDFKEVNDRYGHDLGDSVLQTVAEKIIKEIQAPLNVSVGGVATTLSVEASIGISIFPKHGTDADTLVTSADRAMYRAKQDKSGYSFAQ
jgi:GGDEF domain-containing protein